MYDHVYIHIYIYIYVSGWWFQTCFHSNYMGCHPSHWLIFFREVETTNQIYIYIYVYVVNPPKTGWWFGTCFVFPNSLDDDPIWLIFFRGVGQPPTSKRATLFYGRWGPNPSDGYQDVPRKGGSARWSSSSRTLCTGEAVAWALKKWWIFFGEERMA